MIMLKSIFSTFFQYLNIKPFKVIYTMSIMKFEVKCKSDQCLWTNYKLALCTQLCVLKLIIIIVTVYNCSRSQSPIPRALALAAS